MIAVNFLDRPARTNRWDKWSRPPWKGEIFRRNLDKTATVVSRIGIARRSSGVANEPSVLSVFGSNLTVRVAIKTPKKSAPASPI